MTEPAGNTGSASNTDAAAKKAKTMKIVGAVAVLGLTFCCCCPSSSWIGYVNVIDNPDPPGAIGDEWDRRYDDVVAVAEAGVIACPGYHRSATGGRGPAPVGPQHAISNWDNILLFQLECGEQYGSSFHTFQGTRRSRSAMGWPGTPSDGSFSASRSFIGTSPEFENSEVGYWTTSPQGRTILRMMISRELDTPGCHRCMSRAIVEVEVPQ